MWFSCFVLMAAISILHLNRMISDEVIRIVLMLFGRFCLFLSLVYSPWIIKLLVVVTILVIPVCTQRYALRQSRCSRLCIARSNCPHVPV